MRISRGSEVIGEWPLSEVKERIENKNLLPTDFFYDEDASDWLRLSELRTRQPPLEGEKILTKSCYCGSGLSFRACCGNQSKY